MIVNRHKIIHPVTKFRFNEIKLKFKKIYSFRSLPEIDGLSKETVLTSWMAKFDCIFKGKEGQRIEN